MTAILPAPDIHAEIVFLSTEEGGRKGPVQSGYFPNHDFHFANGEINGAKHEYFTDEPVYPGERVEALLQLLGPERQVGRLYAGFEFTVQEGAHIVGYGKIIEVLNPLLNRAT
jgi:translation elongation factor EF-Tu-like GTPase